MTPRLQHNHDLSAAFMRLITTTSIDWVMEQQPADWRLEPWQRQWRMNPPLPHPQVLDGLQEEYGKHQRIRRSFVFSYQHRSPLELFIAAMAWGLGTDNRGPARVRTILTQPNAAKAIEAVVNTVRQDGAVPREYASLPISSERSIRRDTPGSYLSAQLKRRRPPRR